MVHFIKKLSSALFFLACVAFTVALLSPALWFYFGTIILTAAVIAGLSMLLWIGALTYPFFYGQQLETTHLLSHNLSTPWKAFILVVVFCLPFGLGLYFLLGLAQLVTTKVFITTLCLIIFLAISALLFVIDAWTKTIENHTETKKETTCAFLRNLDHRWGNLTALKNNSDPTWWLSQRKELQELDFTTSFKHLNDPIYHIYEEFEENYMIRILNHCWTCFDGDIKCLIEQMRKLEPLMEIPAFLLFLKMINAQEAISKNLQQQIPEWINVWTDNPESDIPKYMTNLLTENHLSYSYFFAKLNLARCLGELCHTLDDIQYMFGPNMLGPWLESHITDYGAQPKNFHNTILFTFLIHFIPYISVESCRWLFTETESFRIDQPFYTFIQDGEDLAQILQCCNEHQHQQLFSLIFKNKKYSELIHNLSQLKDILQQINTYSNTTKLRSHILTSLEKEGCLWTEWVCNCADFISIGPYLPKDSLHELFNAKINELVNDITLAETPSSKIHSIDQMLYYYHHKDFISIFFNALMDKADTCCWIKNIQDLEVMLIMIRFYDKEHSRLITYMKKNQDMLKNLCQFNSETMELKAFEDSIFYINHYVNQIKNPADKNFVLSFLEELEKPSCPTSNHPDLDSNTTYVLR